LSRHAHLFRSSICASAATIESLYKDLVVAVHFQNNDVYKAASLALKAVMAQVAAHLTVAMAPSGHASAASQKQNNKLVKFFFKEYFKQLSAPSEHPERDVDIAIDGNTHFVIFNVFSFSQCVQNTAEQHSSLYLPLSSRCFSLPMFPPCVLFYLPIPSFLFSFSGFGIMAAPLQRSLPKQMLPALIALLQNMPLLLAVCEDTAASAAEDLSSSSSSLQPTEVTVR
jgi:hypothetical protein